MIRIERAPAYATVQDAGRRGFMASGVPRAGAMDLRALGTLNSILGNDAHTAAIEWALSGGAVRFETATVFAIGGAESRATLGGRPVGAWQAYHASAGDMLELDAPHRGRFAYVAVGGGLDVPTVMGSRSTYLPGSFGGFEGRRLKSGDAIAIGSPAKRTRYPTGMALPVDLRPELESDVIRFIPRDEPSGHVEWIVSAASDRTGYRLEGSQAGSGGSMTSEPVCPGVVQVPPDGNAIVLMADAPTVGGYRIAGVVISADLGALAQKLPGETVVLEPVTLELAQRELARLSARLDSVREWSLR